MINGIPGLGFVQKWPFRDIFLAFFENWFVESPFYCFLLVRAFWARLSKKGKISTPPKRESLTDNCKGHFLVFFVFFFSFLFSFSFLLFFWGFKGQVRWPKRPPDLALNPPYLFFCLFLCLFFGLFLVLFFFLSPFWEFRILFSVSLCFSLALCFTSFFHSFFLSLSLSLVLFVLPYFLVFFCFLVFVSFFVCLVSLLLVHETNNIKPKNLQFCFSNPFFLFFGCLSCFVFQIPFPCLCFVPDFKLCFLFNISVSFKEDK